MSLTPNHYRQPRYDVAREPGTDRLDAGESAFFLRELEQIDKRAFMRKFPELKARQIIPTFESVAAWAHVYTWREWTPYGSTKIIANAADDLPMGDVTGAENSQIIKDLGNAYGYSLKEIRNAAAMNTPLDALRAQTMRQSFEQKVDSILAKGDADNKLNGILALDAASIPAANRVASVAPSNKTAGGTTWGTLLAPNATGQEIANDLIGLASQIVSDTDGIWSRFRIALPIDQYNLAAAARINDVNNTTALQFALANGFIESIVPWYQCKSAGAGGTNRALCLPPDPIVLGGIVPMEWTPQPPQQRNLAFVVNCMGSCGGVVCRYPVAMRYMDGI